LQRVVGRLSRLLARRRTIAAVAGGWIIATALVGAVMAPDLIGVVGLTALGGIVLAAMQAHRQHGMILRELRAQSARDRRVAPPAPPEPPATPAEIAAAVTPTLAASLDEVLDRLKLTALSLGRLSEDLAACGDTVRRVIVAEIDRATLRMEAVQNLYAMVPVGARVPARPGTSPQFLLRLVELLRSARPGLVVVCGGGTSALWCALAVRQLSLGSRVVALEHDEHHAGELADLVAAHGVADIAEVRHAPLETVAVDGVTQWWYGRGAWADLDAIGLLAVAASSADAAPPARLACLWLLAGRLVDGGVIAVDDAGGAGESAAMERWLDRTPSVSAERYPGGEDVAVLRRRAGGRQVAVT
jgi:predicted O-methyltransferase YrrM